MKHYEKRKVVSYGTSKNISLAIIAAQNPIDMVELPLLFKDNEIPYIFDPGQQVTSLSGEQLKQAISGSKVLIGNDYEIKLIQEKTKWTLEELQKQTEILIITLGEKGSQIYTKNKEYNIKPADPENTSDPTGAGDAYRGGFYAARYRGLSMEASGAAGATAFTALPSFCAGVHLIFPIFDCLDSVAK